MNPIFLTAVQALQAFGVFEIFRDFIIAVVALGVTFYALSFFLHRGK